MKKFLALVLALVMTMSLVTISAGAEDFTDDASITYEEAVDVMTAIGVVGGYADGSFNPQGTLTRGAAAKIICNMILGPTAAGALAAVEAPFKDVPADHVFSGYIAYCASEGIVGGYTDGTFKPAGTLTGYAFMKMLLGALGYDAVNEGYTGANFAINVAKRALNIGLDDGLTSDFVGTKALTREEACLYAFNALNAQVVEYDNDSKITIGDIVISNSSKAEGKTKAVVSGSTTTYVPVLFRDEFFKDLDKETTSTDGVDTFNRPAHTWYTSTTKHNADTKVGTYADTADYVVVADKGYTNTLAAYKALVDEDYAGSVAASDMNGTGSAGAILLGDVIEYYLDNTGAVSKAIVARYDIGKITKVDTKLSKTQKEDGHTCKVTIDGVAGDVTAMLDGKIVGFDADTYVKDAYVLFIVKGSDIIASELPATVEGKITASKGTKDAVDGVYYEDPSSLAAYGDQGIYYLGKAEQIMAAESTAAKSDNYAYIYNVDVNTTGKDADGNPATVVTVYYVTVDGVKASAPAKFETTGTAPSISYFFDDGAAGTQGTAIATGTVVAFSINADGKFVEETIKDAKTSDTAITVNKTNPVVADETADKVATDSTTFIFVYPGTSKVETKVVTGYKNVAIATTATLYTIYNADNEALFVFVNENNGTVSSDAQLAVLLGTTPVITKNDDGDYIYTYDVAIDGLATTLSFNQSEANALVANDKALVFGYKMVGDYAQVDTAVGTSGYLTAGTIASKGAGYFVAGSYMSTVDADIYTITVEFDNETSKTNYVGAGAYTIESIEVADGAIFDAGDLVYYTVAAGETNVADSVFVVEFVY